MTNDAQIEHWNGPASEKWIRHADALDRMLAPFKTAILEEAALMDGECVLDIGCGTGDLSLAARRDVGARGQVTGVDVSAPLLELARQRAAAIGEAIAFEQADASTYRAGRPVDCAVSRFGVMFFDEPVAAFRSMRRSLRPEGRMVFTCWQTSDLNPWATLPLRTALPLLPEPPVAPPPGAPGPFAFADADRLRQILSAGGWQGIKVRPWTGHLVMPGTSPAQTAAFLMDLGPLSRLLAELDVSLDEIAALVTSELASCTDADGQVVLEGAAWIVSATAS